jgi:Rrf2 family protein
MRLEISRRSDLAVRALGALGRHGRLKGRRLAEIAGTSSGFMAQVMAGLSQAGYVRSDPGPTGGYELSVDLGDLSVLDVIEAMEGPTVTGRCVLRGGPCAADDGTCALHESWVAARDALLARLEATPIEGVPERADSSS